MRKIDLTRKRFERWFVIKQVFGTIKLKWLCICDCGNIKEVWGMDLKSGMSKSCGCYRNDIVKDKLTTHGCSKVGSVTLEYKIWQSMKGRCYNIKDERYPDYGGRGITVSSEWVNSFENFIRDMGKKPTPEHSLDRFPNNDGNYEKDNCRWATDAEQSRNKRNNRWYEYNGEKMVLSDWAKRFGVYRKTLSYQLQKISFKTLYIKYNRH